MNRVRAIDIRLLGKKRTGDEAVFFNLTKELIALDREHQYLLLTDERDSAKIALLRERLDCVGRGNVRVVSLFGRNRFVWNLWSIPFFLLRTHVDVYHTQYILPLFVPRRTKVVNHIHDVSFRAYPEFIGWRDRFLLSLLIPRSLRRADRIAVPSLFTKEEVMKYYDVPSEKIAVIGNALGEDFLTDEGQPDVARVRDKYHLPEHYLLYVGTFQPRKNIPFLVRALAHLRERLPDVELVLVGNRKGHHVDQALEETIAELGLESVVHFPGYVDQADLPVVLRGAAVFVFPSLYEGFGIPLLEAMGEEVPVAAADIPSLREVAGEAALYFDPTSLASCEEKLYTLLTDNEQKMRGVSLGRGRLSAFSWKKSAAALVALYGEVA